MSSDIIQLDATNLLKLLKTKKITPKELAYTYLEQINKIDTDIKAWEFIDKKIIDTQLEKIEKINPQTHPLWGIPIGIKDIYNTFDMPTQMGSPIWKNFTPGNDARVVHYLRRAGAIILGKTTTAEFAVHYQNKTKNPLDLSRSPGTSSSGSAAAVAANMIPIAFGSQTAGSISRPASYCGIYGYKPTFGVLPRIGVLKTTDSLDTLGFFTKSVDDLKLVLNNTRVQGKNYEYVHKYLDNHISQRNKKFRVGIIQAPKWDLVDEYIKDEFHKYIKNINLPNVTIEQIKTPLELEQIHTIHETIYNKSLSYYFQDEYKQHSLISPILYETIEKGNKTTLSNYHKALKEQAVLVKKMNKYFSKYDVLLTPSTASEAPIGLTTPDIPDSNLIWTFLGMPSISIPGLKGKNNLPVGILAISKKYEDYVLLEFLKLLEQLR